MLRYNDCSANIIELEKNKRDTNTKPRKTWITESDMFYSHHHLSLKETKE